MNNLSKIIGWLLFFSGILIIVLTLWYSYNIFTAQRSLPEFFQTPQDTNASSTLAESQDMQVLLQKAIKDQIKGALPFNFVSKALNLGVWSILALILMSGGSRISDLGIKLIKEQKNERI